MSEPEHDDVDEFLRESAKRLERRRQLMRQEGRQKIDRLSQLVHAGREAPPVPVFLILYWYGYERRGRRICGEIRSDLAARGIATQPDIEETGYDSLVEWVSIEPLASPTVVAERLGTYGAPANPADTDRPTQDEDLVLGTLPSARRGVMSVAAEDEIEVAETRMLVNDFSQLPVLRNDLDVRGYVSWRSIGHARRLGRTAGRVHEFMSTDVRLYDVGTSILKALPDLQRFEFVLVRDERRRICGIVTTTDVAAEFREQFEPFVLLGGIENHLRRIIAAHFTLEEVRACKDSGDTGRAVNDVSDLTFGEYVRLLEAPAHWQRLKWQLVRAEVLQVLDEVRTIRNEVMHFSPDPITTAQLDRLRTFVEFLRPLT